jgi:hypothetical protein
MIQTLLLLSFQNRNLKNGFNPFFKVKMSKNRLLDTLRFPIICVAFQSQNQWLFFENKNFATYHIGAEGRQKNAQKLTYYLNCNTVTAANWIADNRISRLM